MSELSICCCCYCLREGKCVSAFSVNCRDCFWPRTPVKWIPVETFSTFMSAVCFNLLSALGTFHATPKRPQEAPSRLPPLEHSLKVPFFVWFYHWKVANGGTRVNFEVKSSLNEFLFSPMQACDFVCEDVCFFNVLWNDAIVTWRMNWSVVQR